MLDLRRDLLPYLRQGHFLPVAVGGNASTTVPSTPTVVQSGVAPTTVSSAPSLGLPHQYYDKALSHKLDIAKAFGDEYPAHLDIKRPREQKENKEYRRKIYKNPFRGFNRRVARALAYIKQADDFNVVFPTTSAKDQLSEYTGRDYCDKGTLLDWFFAEVVPAYVNDPNAVLLVLPERLPFSQDEYPRPKFHLIPSERVIMHRRGKLAVLLAPYAVPVPMPNGIIRDDGRVLFFVDHDSYAIATETARTLDHGKVISDWDITGLDYFYQHNEAGEIDLTKERIPVFQPLRHYGKHMPAWKVGSQLIERNDWGEELYESLISDAMPWIKSAQEDLNDVGVEKNFHISSREWLKAQFKCKNPKCTNGKVPGGKDENNKPIVLDCPSCKGQGFDVSGSGTEVFWVHDGDSNSMVPGATGGRSSGDPGGYIARNPEPLRVFRAELDQNTQEAYTALNMQFIRQTPLEVSGASKRYDREEMYRELNTQASHIIWLLTQGFTAIDAQRYGPSGEQGKQLPGIPVPARFNLENAELTRAELNDAKVNKYDSTAIEALELKYLAYTVGEESDQYRRYKLRIALDPHRGDSDEAKIYQMASQYVLFEEGPALNRVIERMMLSLHFDGLVSDCLREVPDFWAIGLDRQLKELETRAKLLTGKTRPVEIGADGMPAARSMVVKPFADLQGTKQVDFEQGRSKGA